MTPEILIYNAARQRVGWLGDYESAALTLKHNATDTLELVVPWSSRKTPFLIEQGARLGVRLFDRMVFSGPITSAVGEGPSTTGALTLTAESDWRILQRMLLWPVPTAALTGQTRAEHTRTAPAETAFLDIVRPNVTRLGLPITVPSSAGRGDTVRARARMHTPDDVLVPLLEAAGLGVEVIQGVWPSTQLAMRIYEPRSRPRELTEASGILTSWRWSRSAPEAARGVIGGAGEGKARVFRDHIRTPVASTWGPLTGEVFVDARDVQLDPDNPELDTAAEVAEMLDERLAERVREADVRAGIAVTLSETEHFRVHPDVLWLGDRLTLKTGAGIEYTDLLRSIRFTWSPTEGYLATPTVGERPDDELLGPLVSKLAKAARSIRQIFSAR